MIKTVTITGADDSITPQDLANLAFDFHFSEWAILFSRNSQGANRFPSMEWIKEVVEIKKMIPTIKLSCHLCGAYVRELLKGDISFIAEELAEVWPYFERVQINTHGQPHKIHLDEFIEALKMFPEKEFIFQYDNIQGHDNALRVANQTIGVNVSTLFDLSHGAGVLPTEWPSPLPGIKCGYAGGLSPENLQGELEKIKPLLGDTEIWIDVETKVRSDDDLKFDLAKVDEFLSIASMYTS